MSSYPQVLKNVTLKVKPLLSRFLGAAVKKDFRVNSFDIREFDETGDRIHIYFWSVAPTQKQFKRGKHVRCVSIHLPNGMAFVYKERIQI